VDPDPAGAEFVHCTIEPSLVPGAEADVASLRRQAPTDGLADSSAAARDGGDVSRQAQIQRSALLALGYF
jgi:hypothetical protein